LGLCASVNADCGPGGTCGGLLGPDSVAANNADNVHRVSIIGNGGPSPALMCVGGAETGTACAVDGDCLGGGTCDIGVCMGGPAPGAGCTLPADCAPAGVCKTFKMDLYRGSTAGATFTIAGGLVALANEAHHTHTPWFADAFPTRQFRNDLQNGTDGVPLAGTAFVYMSVGHAPGGGAVNALSCPNLGVCNNAGWCNLGGNAGAPCTANAQCPGGTCTNMAGVTRPFCTTDNGMGDVGGCGRHSTCVAGPTPGKLCFNLATATSANTVDCGAGGTCSAFSATASTAGQFCYKAELFQAQQPFNQGCLPVGHVKRLVDQALPGNACP
jgi:hypothetical protein